jgi:hypothetical protein
MKLVIVSFFALVCFLRISAEETQEKPDLLTVLSGTEDAKTVNRAKKAAPAPSVCVEVQDRSSGQKFLQCEDNSVSSPMGNNIQFELNPQSIDLSQAFGISNNQFGAQQGMPGNGMRSAENMQGTWLTAPVPAPTTVNNANPNVGAPSPRYGGSSYGAAPAPAPAYGPCPSKLLFSCQPQVVPVPCLQGQASYPSPPSYPSYSKPAYSAPSPSY